MAASTVLDVKQVSPFDVASKCSPSLIQLQPHKEAQEWVPSRFNARTTDRNGNLILWNTLSGKINTFRESQKEAVQKMLSQKGFRGALTPLGKYLHERGYIVAKGTHEYRQFQQCWLPD